MPGICSFGNYSLWEIDMLTVQLDDNMAARDCVISHVVVSVSAKQKAVTNVKNELIKASALSEWRLN